MAIETTEIKNRKGFQAIKIPSKMRIDDNKVYLKKIGNVLYLIPFHNPWQNMIDGIDSFTADYMDDREQPNNQSRELFD